MSTEYPFCWKKTFIRCAVLSTGVLASLSSLAAEPSSYSVVHPMSAAEGSPVGSLVLSPSGSFFGTTSNTLIEMSPAGDVTILCSGGTGYSEEKAALAPDGRVYWATRPAPFNYGQIWVYAPGEGCSLVHDFNIDDGSGLNMISRLSPLFFGLDGFLYGTADGGAHVRGAVFRMTTSGHVEVLHAFTDPDGIFPAGPIVQLEDGTIIGATQLGGAFFGGPPPWPAGGGTVYSLAPDGAFRVLHSFSGGADGGGPWNGIFRGPDNAFYGITQSGGSADAAKIFRVTADGDFSVLHTFAEDGSEGRYVTGLLFTPNGTLYGTTNIAGAHESGTIFRMSSAGAITTLHNFYASSDDGSNPARPPILAANGDIYGTAPFGGPSGNGVIYRLSIAPTVEFARASEVVTHLLLLGQSRVSLAIKLSHATDTSVSVPYSISASASRISYSATPGVITFAPGQVEQQLVVNIRFDLPGHCDETLALRLLLPTNAYLGEQQTNSLVVHDPLSNNRHCH